MIKRTSPWYTGDARSAKLEGDVRLRADIGVDGVPKSVTVVRPLGMGLDQSAVAAVKDWRFKPWEKNGEPSVVPVTIEVNFRLKDPTQSCRKLGA